MGIGEDGVRHEDPDGKSAAEGGVALQNTATGTDVAVPCGPATDASSADLPTSEAPGPEHGDAGAKPEDVVASERPKLTAAAKAIQILAGDWVSEPPDRSEAAVHARRSLRFAPLAAMIALAAGAGFFLGTLSAGGFAHQPPASAAVARTADGYDASASLKAQLAELTALKASLDRVNRSANAQFAKIGQRLDSLEHAQAAPTAKLAHMADALDRLEKQHAAASDVTGSIASNPRSKTSEPSLSVPVLSSWIVDDVHNGRAMVESRYGGFFVVGAGSVLPGLGRVQQIERQDGRWVVVTASGLITSPR
jgi:hypothetical protein